MSLCVQIVIIILRSCEPLFPLAARQKFHFLIIIYHPGTKGDNQVNFDLGTGRTVVTAGVNARAPSSAIKNTVVLLSSAKLCIKK